MGFVGLHTARALAKRGDRVVIFDPECRASLIEQRDVGWGGARIEGSDPGSWLSPLARHLLGPARENIVFLHGDAINVSEVIEAVRQHGVEKIVHSASLFDPLLEFEHPYAAFKVNVEAAAAVFEAARVLKTGRLVYLSSIAAYGVREHEPIGEAHPTHSVVSGNPSGPHGAAKAAAEVLGMTYHSAYGVDFVGLRLAGAFGVGMRLPVHIRPMVECAVKNLACTFEQGEMRRDYIYIDDVVTGILSALDVAPDRLKQRIFNIGSGAITSTQELADAVRSVVPGAKIVLGTGMSELEASNIRMRGRLDITASREQLGFSPRHDLRAGIGAYAAELRRFHAG
jgi:UDP-glucose 4-epimerase